MKRRVLIVDDDLPVLEATTMVLEMNGIEVQSHGEGAGIEEKVIAFKPDVILLDYNIGETGNGRKVCDTLKSSPLYKHIKILLFSAVIFDDRDFVNPLFKNFDDYVPKPFDMADLIRKVLE